MVSDARYNTKLWLDAKLTAANILADDEVTEASFITCYANPPYPVRRVFLDKDVDVIFSIGEPTSTVMLGHDQYPYGYEEAVPISISCINKIGVSATEVKWKAEAELRRIAEVYPEGSQRSLTDRRDNNQQLNTTTTLYSTRFTLNYQRDLT